MKDSKKSESLEALEKFRDSLPPPPKDTQLDEATLDVLFDDCPGEATVTGSDLPDCTVCDGVEGMHTRRNCPGAQRPSDAVPVCPRAHMVGGACSECGWCWHCRKREAERPNEASPDERAVAAIERERAEQFGTSNTPPVTPGKYSPRDEALVQVAIALGMPNAQVPKTVREIRDWAEKHRPLSELPPRNVEGRCPARMLDGHWYECSFLASVPHKEHHWLRTDVKDGDP